MQNTGLIIYIFISFFIVFLLALGVVKDKKYDKEWLIRNAIFIYSDESLVMPHFRNRKPFYRRKDGKIEIFFAKSISRTNGEISGFGWDKEELVLNEDIFFKTKGECRNENKIL